MTGEFGKHGASIHKNFNSPRGGFVSRGGNRGRLLTRGNRHGGMSPKGGDRNGFSNRGRDSGKGRFPILLLYFLFSEVKF